MGDHAVRAWLVAIVVALVLGIHVAGRVGAYCSPLKNDSYVYAAFGYRMAHGDVLYRDMSDIKPPGLFMLFALVYRVLPAGRLSIVPLESLFLLLSYYLIYRLCREIYARGVALVVLVLAAVTINYFTVMGHVIEGFGLAENFMVLPAVAAVLFYRRGLSHRQARPLNIRSGGVYQPDPSPIPLLCERAGAPGLDESLLRPVRTMGYAPSFLLAGLFLGLDSTIKQTALPVVAAIVIHWSWSALWLHRTARRWATGCGWLLLGSLLAWSPFVALMLLQGTWHTAWTLLTSDAAAMIGRSTAWPSQWREVLPLQWPLLCVLWAGVWGVERRVRCWVSRSTPPPQQAVSSSDLSLLVIWCSTEAALLLVLPLRSAHYYVTACVPLILLTGVPWAVLFKSVESLSHRTRLAVCSVAVIFSASLYRPGVDAIVPCAIARYRSYDWQADRRFFDSAIHAGPIHYGRGKPWTGPLDR